MNYPYLLDHFIKESCVIIADETKTDIRKTTVDDLPLICPLNAIQFLRFVSMTFPGLIDDGVVRKLKANYWSPRLAIESKIAIIQILALANCQNEKTFLEEIVANSSSGIGTALGPGTGTSTTYTHSPKFAAIQALEVFDGKRNIHESNLWHEAPKGIGNPTWMTRVKFPTPP